MFDSATSMGHLVNRASRLFAGALNRRIRPLGASAGQIPVFLSLADGGSLSQRELVEQSVIEQSTMAATLARMERMGLLLRSKHASDGRTSLFRLSETGVSIVESLYDALDEGNGTALSGFSGEEVETLRSLISRVIDNVEHSLANGQT